MHIIYVRVYNGKWLDQTQRFLNKKQLETAYEREQQQQTKESVTYIVHKQF